MISAPLSGALRALNDGPETVRVCLPYGSQMLHRKEKRVQLNLDSLRIVLRGLLGDLSAILVLKGR